MAKDILDSTYDAIMHDEVLRVNFYGRAREVAAENERLRTALNKIAKMEFSGQDYILHGPSLLIATARAALNP